MSKMLTFQEMLVAAHESEMPGVEKFLRDACELHEQLGSALADHLEIDGPVRCEFDPGDGVDLALMGGFAPRENGQPVPPVLEECDPDADWEPRCIDSMAERP